MPGELKTRNFILGLLLIPALIAAVYGVAISAPFVYDDRIHIVENPYVTSFRSIFDFSAARALWNHPYGLSARPLLMLTYGLNYAVSGFNPAPFRLTNYLIHAANSFFVFLIMWELGKAPVSQQRRVRMAFLAGALFAVHPLMTESVTYIAGRSSSLCALFYFAGVYGVLLAGRASPHQRSMLLIFVLGCAFTGWLVKQEAVTLPVAGITLIWLPWPGATGRRERGGRRGQWVATAFLVAGIGLLLILQAGSLKTVSTDTQRNEVLVGAGFEETPEFWPYFWTSLKEWTTYYLWRLFFPAKLNVDPQSALVHGPSFWVLASLACILGLVAAAYCFRKRAPIISAGIALLLVSPLSAYCLFPLADVVAEHRAYITALGAVIILAFVVSSMPRALLMSCLLIFAFALQTRARNAVWNDEVLLWQDAALQAPDKPRPHFNLGGLYRVRGQVDRSITEYEIILQHYPEHSSALNNLASIYLDLNNLSRAEELIAPVVARQSTFAPAYQTLAIVRIRQGRFDEAQGLLYRANELNPYQPMVHHNLGDVLVNKGQLEKAMIEYTRELQLNPNSLPTHLNLAKTYEMAGFREKSIEHYRILQRADPNNREAHDALTRLQ
jgi:protein O-mannosyl-transferase